MRVLHLIPSLAVGGAEQTAANLMIGLSAAHEVTGVSLYPSVNSTTQSKLDSGNIRLRFLGKRRGFDPRMFYALDRVLKEIQPHVVHTHLSVLRYVLPALRKHRIPVAIHTLHNVADHETDMLGRALQWFAFRRYVLPIAISREVAASATRIYQLECAAVIPNCIPVEKYRVASEERVRWRQKEGYGPNDFLFICVGRLEPQKNPTLLLEAFAALHDPRANLVMLGDGSLHQQLTASIRRLGLERRVHLIGKRSDIAECLAASDVFVLASNWEGSPLAVMEAMASGLPVVATSVGGVPELVESGRQGILVARGDLPAFSNAMRTLLNYPEMRRAMAVAAAARAATCFDVKQMVQAYSQMYCVALARDSRQSLLLRALKPNGN